MITRRTDFTTTKSVLLNQPLPLATETYAVISNQFIMNKLEKLFKNNNFEIKRELYAAYNNNDVAIGKYIIQHSGDEDMSMLFYFVNSYDKTNRFRCGIGAIVNENDAVIVSDSANYSRIHKGTALEDAESCMVSQITAAGNAFNALVKHKEAMKTIEFTDEQFYALVSELYFKDLISIRQVSTIKQEFKTPSYAYVTGEKNLWTLYNHIQVALKKTHAKDSIANSRLVHYYVCNKYKILTHPIVLGIQTPQTQQVETEEHFVDPNQTNLLDEIEHLETTQEDLDQQIEETIGKTVEETISETASLVREMLDDDMSSCPDEEDEPDEGNTRIIEEMQADEEADMIKNEEIIEEREEEDQVTSFLDESEVLIDETTDEEDRVTEATSEEETLEQKIANVLEDVYEIDSEGFEYEEKDDEYIVTTAGGDTLYFDKADFVE